MRQTEGHSLHHELLSGAEYKSQGENGQDSEAGSGCNAMCSPLSRELAV